MKKPRNYENTAADKAMDKKGAKKAGVSLSQWENSAADRRADIKGAMKMAAKRGK